MTDDYDFSTPMMQQYLKLKAEYTDCILLFRLGDFYEMFLDDAKLGADILEITLTSRTRGKDGRIPMAGVPYHAVDGYINKLVKAGHKVAICDQMSEPGKGLVEREVTRIITPGTILDQQSLDSRAHNYLLVLHQVKHHVLAAAADLGTGDVRAQTFDLKVTPAPEIVSQILATLKPSEILITSTLKPEDLEHIFQRYPVTVYPLSLSPSAPLTTLDEVLAALHRYLTETQKQSVTHLSEPQPILTERHLQLDTATIANLELVDPGNFRNQKYTLLRMLDRTHTAMGGRLLKEWILQPLRQRQEIEARLSVVDWLLQHSPVRETLQIHCKEIGDVERLLSRLSVGLGTPRDIRHLVNSLKQSRSVAALVHQVECPELKSIFPHFTPAFTDLITEVDTLFVSDPPIDAKQGGLITEGHHPELDKWRSLIRHNREKLLELEQAERAATGISTLKVRFNKVFGFYIEISNSHLDKAPPHYLRKQTLVNGERFITPELKEYEDQILTAEDKSHSLEYQLFVETVAKIKKVTDEIQAIAQAIAQLDCLLSFAEVSQHYRYTKPILTETGELNIVQGRHPVVERVLTREFVPNDISLSSTDHQLMLLTGPNMAGKSVLMRQTALIVLMAHLGCYVPAHSATISLTDRIFVRSGAQDAIAGGMSTFMVEMSETAYILNHATEKSLIIMDEIGRGTSTYDGISIASAIAEFLVAQPIGPKTLFATHYHELQALEQQFPNKIMNMHLAVKQHEDQPVFMYTLQPGPASHSFGVAVAKLAKLPTSVVQRAERLLTELETHHVTIASNSDLPTQPIAGAESRPASPILRELEKLNINQLTPLAALNLLARWKSNIKD